MVAALAHSLVHKLLVRLDLFSFFLFGSFLYSATSTSTSPFETALRAKVLDLPHPLPPPASPSKPSHSPSWLRLPNKFPGTFFSSTPVPLSAACSPFIFFSFFNLFIFPVWRAPCLTALPSPIFFSLSHSEGQGTDHQ